MAINNFGTTDYVRDTEDLAAWKLQNPSEVKPVPEKVGEQKQPAEVKPKADSFGATNTNVLATKTDNKQYIRSNLQIDIKDKDGFANFGKADIRAKVSGDINITKDFILDQLSKMKDDAEKKYNPPRFDAERKQFIISGTAKDAALGFIDVNFTIRLGEVNNGLAFQVDSWITRSSIYSDLKSTLLEAGIVTHEKDKLLYIKPTFGQVIDVPVSKDKNHSGRVEWIDTNAANTTVNIDKFGNVHAKLKEVNMIASTDIGTINKKVEKPDVASIKFDFAMDSDMKPRAEFKDGKVNANVSQKDLEKNLGKENMAFIEQTFGTALSVSITGLGGNLKVTDKGIDVQAQTNISAKATNTDSQVTTDVKVSVQDSKPVELKANNLKADLIGDQKINAEEVTYDTKKEGINVEVKGLDANVNASGINAQAQGSGTINKPKEGDININFQGNTNATIQKNGADLKVSGSGSHNVTIGDKRVDVVLDKGKVTGTYDSTIPTGEPAQVPPDDTAPKEKTKISVEVKSVDADGSLKTNELNASAKVKDGGIRAEIGDEIKIRTDATITGSIDGDKIKGKGEIHGADFEVRQDGSIGINAKGVKAEGQFKKDNGLAVKGKVTGDVSVEMDNDMNIEVQERKGSVDVQFEKGPKIKVQGKGGDATFKIDKNQEYIEVDLKKADAKTQINTGKVKVNAHTKADVNIHVHSMPDADDITIQSKNGTSTTDVKVKELIKGQGTVGDVTVKVHSTPDTDDIVTDAKNANLTAHIKNAKGTLNIDVESKNNFHLHVDPKDNIQITGKNAQTKAHVNLKDKVDVNTQGKDFNVNVTHDGDDVAIKVKDVKFDSKINIKDKINVNAQTASNSDINVKVSDREDYTKVNIDTKSALKGDVSVAGKLKSDFTDPKGFSLFVHDTPETTKIKTNFDINLDGALDTDAAQIGVKGKGNLDLDITDEPLTTDVNITYDGKLGGDVKTKPGEVTGKYSIDGKAKVGVHNDDINVNVEGSINADLKSKQFGIGAEMQANGTKENPIHVSINVKDNPIVDVNLEKGGFVELKDIDQLHLGNSMDPTVAAILDKLKTKSAKIAYQGLEIKNNAEKVSVKVQANGIKTEFGNISAGVSLRKDGPTIQLDKGIISMQPNEKLFKLIQDEVSKKYKIKVTGSPELKDGVLSIKGEIKSEKGVVQLADFNIKASVVENNLVLDLDKAKILKIVGPHAVNSVINQVLNHTDIDHIKVDKSKITIKLGDIVKDLALTEGVNFTGLQFKDDKIQIGFFYNSIDKDIAGFAKKKDVDGLSKYLETLDYKHVTGEALSTAYSTIANSKNVDKSSKFMVDLVKMYNNNPNIPKDEFDKGLTWISKNQGVKSSHIQDDITMKFTQLVNLKTPEGDKLIKNLPVRVVANLANNLDQTISQGGGMSWITKDERATANYMRKLKGLPENHKQI